ncbi:MAG: putative toxin-antitoxin system toxin component, PIN family [Chloroflexota bacterium]
MAHRPRPRVFLDTNVIFSGLCSPSGAPGQILDRFAAEKLQVVVSQQVLDELIQTISAKLPLALSALKGLLESTPLEIVRDPEAEDVGRWRRLINAQDAPILTAAVAAQPDYLVTGDRHFFENRAVPEESGLTILTPGEFIEQMDAREAPRKPD